MATSLNSHVMAEQNRWPGPPPQPAAIQEEIMCTSFVVRLRTHISPTVFVHLLSSCTCIAEGVKK